MRTMFLIAVWMIAFTTVAFSQSSFSMQQEPSMKFKIGNPGAFALNGSLNKGKLDVPFSTRTPLFRNPQDRAVKIGKPAEENFMVQKGMPVLKPKGSFSMPVYKPDSTIKFTLLIKEYKKEDLNSFK